MATCGISGCHKPVFTDLRTNIAHDFCGRSHAALALVPALLPCALCSPFLPCPPAASDRRSQDRGMIAALQTPHGKCHRCKLHGCAKTVFFDQAKGRVHDFCSRRHAQLVQTNLFPFLLLFLLTIPVVVLPPL